MISFNPVMAHAVASLLAACSAFSWSGDFHALHVLGWKPTIPFFLSYLWTTHAFLWARVVGGNFPKVSLLIEAGDVSVPSALGAIALHLCRVMGNILLFLLIKPVSSCDPFTLALKGAFLPCDLQFPSILNLKYTRKVPRSASIPQKAPSARVFWEPLSISGGHMHAWAMLDGWISGSHILSPFL